MKSAQQPAANPAERNDQGSRLHWLPNFVLPLAAVVFLGAVLFSLDNWLVRLVRDLDRTPGVVPKARLRGPDAFGHGP